MTAFVMILAGILWHPAPPTDCFSEYFVTENVAPPFQPRHFSGLARTLFQQSLKTVPESILVTSVVAAEETSAAQPDSQRREELFQKTYASIAADPQVNQLKSVLPFCLSDVRQNRGHYFLALPASRNAKTRSIVFLHGFGGNFLFYLKVLKDAYPNCVIVIPSWGSSWSHGNLRYLNEVFADIRIRHDVEISRPQLMAISAGGPTAFEIYNQAPDEFSDLVVLASAPRRQTIAQLKPALKIHMVNGIRDTRFRITGVRDAAALLSKRIPKFRLTEIPADHFFFLSHTQEWQQALKQRP